MKNLINILDRIGTIIPGCCMTYLYNQIFKLGKHLCYLFIVIYSFIPSAAEGQDILLAFKQIEKNNYEKALEILDVDKNVKASSKIDKCVNNNTMEIVLFLKEYGLSRIFASQQYSGYSLEESYKHIDSEYYRLFLDKEKNYECLQKQDITLEECQKHKSDVDDRLFDLYNDDIDSLNEFIIRFTSSKHINTAIEIRNKLAYEYFSQKGTLSDFEEFIKLYPNASQVAQAKEMITAIEFETICKINSVKAYNDFLKKYPDAKEYHKAKEKRDNAAFEDAKNENTVDAYNNFITVYNDSKNVPIAIERMEKLELEHMTTLRDARNFIDKYPNSNYLNEVSLFVKKNIPEINKYPSPFGADATCLWQDSKGTLWLGTGSSGGVYILRSNSSEWQELNSGIGPVHVTNIAEVDNKMFIKVTLRKSTFNTDYNSVSMGQSWYNKNAFKYYTFNSDSSKWIEFTENISDLELRFEEIKKQQLEKVKEKVTLWNYKAIKVNSTSKIVYYPPGRDEDENSKYLYNFDGKIFLCSLMGLFELSGSSFVRVKTDGLNAMDVSQIIKTKDGFTIVTNKSMIWKQVNGKWKEIFNLYNYYIKDLEKRRYPLPESLIEYVKLNQEGILSFAAIGNGYSINFEEVTEWAEEKDNYREEIKEFYLKNTEEQFYIFKDSYVYKGKGDGKTKLTKNKLAVSDSYYDSDNGYRKTFILNGQSDEPWLFLPSTYVNNADDDSDYNRVHKSNYFQRLTLTKASAEEVSEIRKKHFIVFYKNAYQYPLSLSVNKFMKVELNPGYSYKSGCAYLETEVPFCKVSIYDFEISNGFNPWLLCHFYDEVEKKLFLGSCGTGILTIDIK